MPGSLITACLVSLVVLLALLVMKLVYMKRRRLTAIRSQNLQPASRHVVSLNSSFLPPQAKATNSTLLALLVGYFGSPSCETDLKSVLDTNSQNQRRTASFMYQLHRQPKQPSSKSYSAACNSSKTVTSQAHPSTARITPSMSSFAFSGRHSNEDATNFWPRRSDNCKMLTYLTKVWPRTAAVAPLGQRCSLLVDHPYSGQLGGSHEKSDANSNSFWPRILCTPGDRTTAVVDHAPTSLRLVGVTDVTAVPFSFLSAFPPSSYVLSPRTGTRDSLQLPRSHPKLTRKPVPPLPPMPSYNLPSQGPSCIPLNEVLPSPCHPTGMSAVADQVPTHMSDVTLLSTSNPAQAKAAPLVSPYPAGTSTPGKLVPRTSDPADPPLVFAVQKMIRKTKYKRSAARSRMRSGIIPGTSPLRAVVFPEDMIDRKLIWYTPPCDKENSVSKTIDVCHVFQSKGASYRSYLLPDSTSCPDIELALCRLSQVSNRPSSAHSVRSTKSLSQSDVGGSLSDLSSLQTPRFDHIDEVDIGMLGLDRFCWSEEGEDLIQSQSSNVKNDSVAVVSFWEEGEWLPENNQCSDIGLAW
ncbi:hypothetical protein M405DRAFT_864161 [Rhizopogon salebrosus TDB-379]|nr:hypothetical protein M405DRAFT_864161 [Rhizopogon salebrosus TDB-379]